MIINKREDFTIPVYVFVVFNSSLFMVKLRCSDGTNYGVIYRQRFVSFRVVEYVLYEVFGGIDVSTL